MFHVDFCMSSNVRRTPILLILKFKKKRKECASESTKYYTCEVRRAWLFNLWKLTKAKSGGGYLATFQRLTVAGMKTAVIWDVAPSCLRYVLPLSSGCTVTVMMTQASSNIEKKDVVFVAVTTWNSLRFQLTRVSVRKNLKVDQERKHRSGFYEKLSASSLLFDSETCVLRKRDENMMQSSETTCSRSVIWCTQPGWINNETVRELSYIHDERRINVLQTRVDGKFWREVHAKG